MAKVQGGGRCFVEGYTLVLGREGIIRRQPTILSDPQQERIRPGVAMIVLLVTLVLL